MTKKKDEITIRSSAAEYLTYVASAGDQQDSIEMRYEDENIWLTQKMMATLYDVDVRTISENIKKIYTDSELEQDSTIRKFRIVQTEGSRQVTRETNHYNLQMIIAVGFKVNNERVDAEKPHMGLTIWVAALEGKSKILKSDVSTAKNYFTEQEMRSLESIVSAYLEKALTVCSARWLKMRRGLTPIKWMTQMNAIGIVSKAGHMEEHMPIVILRCPLQLGFLQNFSYII